jgi:hypothetical protein
LNTNVHVAARIFYAPLIATIPGNRYYPSRAEHKNLVDWEAEMKAGTWSDPEEE